jgi:hypothetical protein
VGPDAIRCVLDSTLAAVFPNPQFGISADGGAARRRGAGRGGRADGCTISAARAVFDDEFGSHWLDPERLRAVSATRRNLTSTCI